MHRIEQNRLKTCKQEQRKSAKLLRPYKRFANPFSKIKITLKNKNTLKRVEKDPDRPILPGVGVCRAVQVRLVQVRVNDFLIGMITFVGVKFQQTPLFYPRGFTVGRARIQTQAPSRLWPSALRLEVGAP